LHRSIDLSCVNCAPIFEDLRTASEVSFPAARRQFSAQRRDLAAQLPNLLLQVVGSGASRGFVNEQALIAYAYESDAPIQCRRS
jgi:hypothetical protein